MESAGRCEFTIGRIVAGLAGEAALGLAIGLSLAIVLEVFQVAAQIVSLQAGLRFRFDRGSDQRRGFHRAADAGADHGGTAVLRYRRGPDAGAGAGGQPAAVPAGIVRACNSGWAEAMMRFAGYDLRRRAAAGGARDRAAAAGGRRACGAGAHSAADPSGESDDAAETGRPRCCWWRARWCFSRGFSSDDGDRDPADGRDFPERPLNAGQFATTEKPTPQRLKKAREKGDFPAAREFVSALQFFAFLAWRGPISPPGKRRSGCDADGTAPGVRGDADGGGSGER